MNIIGAIAKRADVSPEEKRKFEVETNKMLDFLAFDRAMKLIRRLDPVLFKDREAIQKQREIIFAKVYEMQAKDQSLSFAKCWHRLRQEQPKLFEHLPEILAADRTVAESCEEDG